MEVSSSTGNAMLPTISKKFQVFFLSSAIASSLIPFNPPKVQAQESLPPQTQKSTTKSLSDANLVAESTKPSVVRVVVGCEAKARWAKSGKIYNLEIKGHGSGFFANSDGYIVTNAHVTEITKNTEECKKALLEQFAEQLAADGENISDDDKLNLLEMKPIKQVVLANGDKFPFEVIVSGKPVGEGQDVAIIKINVRNAPALKLADSDQVRVFDWVAAAGYPGVADLEEELGGKKALNEATFTDGKVSARKNLKDGTPVIQISAASTHGNSGGPVVNERGEVIGIVTFGPSLKDNFTFIFTSNTIAQFLQQAGIANSESLVNQKYREGLQFYNQGSYTQAMQRFQLVKRLFPQHSGVDNLIQNCEQRIARTN